MTRLISFLVSGLVWTAYGQAPASTHDRAREILAASLKDSNPDVRMHAVESLGLLGPWEPYLSQLEAMLGDKDVQVRVATITSLLDLSDGRTLPALRTALDSDVPEVSFAAATALWTLRDPAGKEALMAVLSGETKTSSGFFTKQKRDALRMLHTPKTLFMFALRQGAIFAPFPGLGAGISSMQGILSDAAVSGRVATILLLGADRDPEVLTDLEDALADKDWSVRAAAVHAIAVRNDPKLAAQLVPVMDDKKEAVRVRAAAGYLRLEWIKSGAVKVTARTRPVR